MTSIACTPYLHTVATFPSEIHKVISTVLFIRTSDYLRYLRRKQTVIPLPTTPQKMSQHYLVKCKTFTSV